LKEMQFNLSFTWSYDPLGVIPKLRVEKKSTTYFHTCRPEIERYKNQIQWARNTLQEPEEHLMSTQTLHTPVTQEKIGKRNKEEESLLVIDIPSEDFKIIYRKRTKLNSKETHVSSLIGDQATLSPATLTTSQG